jgi:hypothetical protein
LQALGLANRATPPAGDDWPTDAPGLRSADFDYDAAASGHFLPHVHTDRASPLPLKEAGRSR